MSKYGTEIMKADECLLFVETAMENGSDPAEAIADMRMIDTIMQVKRNHLKVAGHIKKTNRGYFRKGSDLYSAIDNVITARANNIEM